MTGRPNTKPGDKDPMVEAGGLEHMVQVLLNKQLPANMFGSQKRKSPALGEAWGLAA